jgi:hypothetical protein
VKGNAGSQMPTVTTVRYVSGIGREMSPRDRNSNGNPIKNQINSKVKNTNYNWLDLVNSKLSTDEGQAVKKT